MDESSASSSFVRKHFEKNKGAGTVTSVYVQTLPEQVEVEREYDQQLWNHIKGQHASAFASKTVLVNMVHPLIQLLTHTFLFDFGGQKLDNYYDYACSHYSRIFDYSCCR